MAGDGGCVDARIEFANGDLGGFGGEGFHDNKWDGSIGPTAERVAAARYLLELNCQMPILVRSWTDSHKHITETSQSRRGQ
jgi:hypothetical protein